MIKPKFVNPAEFLRKSKIGITATLFTQPNIPHPNGIISSKLLS